MKKTTLITLVLLFVLSMSSAMLTGCAGCGTQNNNANDMVESTPANTEEGIMEDESAFTNETDNVNSNGGNTNNTDISNDADSVVDENNTINDNANVTDSNGNPIVTEGEVVDESGNIVDGAVGNVGDAAKDVIDGVGNGVKELTE